MDRQRTVEQAVEPMGAPRHAFDAGRFAASAQNTDEQGEFRDSLVSRLYFRSILGAHCITEFKAKNRPPAVSTATSAPHEPNLHVVPVGFVEIGYKLTPCPLIPNLGI